MRWYEAKLVKLVQTGTDDTRNPICELQETGESVLVRKGPWVPSHDPTEGNQFDMIERTLQTKSPAEAFESVDAVALSGDLYEIDRVLAEGYMTTIRVRRCDKPWESPSKTKTG